MFENFVAVAPYLGLLTLGGMIILPLTREVVRRRSGDHKNENTHKSAVRAVFMVTYQGEDHRDN
jgi:hypothetical protein